MRNQAGQTKKDLRKARLLVTMATAATLFSSVNLALANSMDGAPSIRSQQEAVAQSGRALLTVEDLKTLLGVTARDPSAVKAGQPSKEASAGAYDFSLALSRGEKQSLINTVLRSEMARMELVSKLEQETTSKKTALREKRKDVQASRTAAGDVSDEKLSRSLFESLILESNVEAKAAKQIEKFDNEHVVNFSFVEIEGRRVVNSIAIGDETVWSLSNTHQIAQK